MIYLTVCVGNLTMPLVALGLAVVITFALSCFACAGYEEKLEKEDKIEIEKEQETHQKMLKQNSIDTGICIFDDNILNVAKTADFIVNGYAFTSDEKQIRVLNLNNMDKATVLDKTGEVIMTSMDDVEISIVKKYFEKNKEFLRDAEAI